MQPQPLLHRFLILPVAPLGIGYLTIISSIKRFATTQLQILYLVLLETLCWQSLRTILILWAMYVASPRASNISLWRMAFFLWKGFFQNDVKYVSLQIIPASLINIICVAFCTNPIGGHFNFYRTYHRIHQRYFWPGMWQYIKRMCKACPGCSLSNLTKKYMHRLGIYFSNSCADASTLCGYFCRWCWL